ncbi:MAG TPA: hypothetical protein VGP72_10800 [Planctomycetota bacterium]|jgi:hypothetical protein
MTRLRILDCGLRILGLLRPMPAFNPQSAIRNPQSVLILGIFFAAATFAGTDAKQPSSVAPLPTAEVFSKAFNTPPSVSWALSKAREPLVLSLSAPPKTTWDLRQCSSLSVVAERENSILGVVRLRWVIHSRVGGIYLAATPSLVPTAGSATVSIAIDACSADLVPAGHQRPWDGLAAAEVTGFELRAECGYPADGQDESFVVKLTDAALNTSPPALPKATLLDVALEPAPEGYRAKAMLSFRIEPEPADPYAIEGEGDVRVTLPGGRQFPAFFDQTCARLADGPAVRAIAAGAPVWRAYLPDLPTSGALDVESGSRRWRVPIQQAFPFVADHGLDGYGQPADGVGSASLPAGAEAGATPPERWQPPLEVPAPDIGESGKGFSPAYKLETRKGHWQQAPSNPLAGVTTLWRPVPFWNPAWHEFDGAVRPNDILSEQMDSLLARAAKNGVTRPLVILDGESFQRGGTFNWSSHPLNGVLSGPRELFRDPRGIEFCRRWARYCVARWALAKPVSSLCVTPTLTTPGCSEFFESLSPMLASWSRDLGVPVYSLHPLSRVPIAVRTVTSFDANEPGGWQADARHGDSVSQKVPQAGSDGGACLEVKARSPATTIVNIIGTYWNLLCDWNVTPPDDFLAADTLLFDVWVPPEGPPDLRLGIHVKDRDGLWYETLLPGMPNPGDWCTFGLDLTERNSNGLKAIGHKKDWAQYSRMRLSEIGIHVYSTHPNWNPTGKLPVPLSLRFDSIRAVKMPRSEGEPPPKIVLLDEVGRASLPAGVAPASAPAGKDPKAGRDAGATTLQRGDLWEQNFTVTKTFSNPFDPRSCDLAALITTPSGKHVRVPAFFNIRCERREDKPGGSEIVEPVGSEFFTVRYRVIETGPHKVTFELREGGRYDLAKREWEPDPRFTPEGKGQEPTEKNQYGKLGYPYQPNGRRPIDTIKWVAGNVTSTLKLPSPAFVAEKETKPFHGFLRVAEDKRHFEYDDGTFFYPIGPCLRSPADHRVPYRDPVKFSGAEIDRIARRGTYQYDEYFSESQRVGVNWARVWMCPFWGGLEWRRDWPGYQGVGRYNMLNAWRVDYLIDQAAAKGMSLEICLTNHGQYSISVDTEWRTNPMGAKLGGPITAAMEFFTLGEAKIQCENRLRYAMARYAHATNISAWGLLSELEWTEEYYNRLHEAGFSNGELAPKNLDAWHTEVAEFLKAQDPNKHLTATHSSQPWHGVSTMRLPAIDVATSNAYGNFEYFAPYLYNAPHCLDKYWAGVPGTALVGFSKFNKPSLVEEQGRHWVSQNTKEQLDAELHCELWGSMVQPLAGATGYWWWLHLHLDKRWDDYMGLAKFMQGEDMRPAKGEAMLEPALRTIEMPDVQLLGRVLRSDRRAYIWVYHPQTPYGVEVPDVPNATLKLASLNAGKYTVEFWDTYAGKPIEKREIELTAKDGKTLPISIPLPVIKKDLAIKVKPK